MLLADCDLLSSVQSTMLKKIRGDTEELLKLAFENYYLLSSQARKGIMDGACSPAPGQNEFPPMALVAGVQLFEAMRDVFHPSDVEWMGDRFRIAAKGRWSRLASLCDDGSQQVENWVRAAALPLVVTLSIASGPYFWLQPESCHSLYGSA